MSKPDRYKTPEEKGAGVPGTATNDSTWKPYTIPYTGAGAQRSAGGSSWVPQRPHATSHAAPPLYITGDANAKKEDDPPADKGKGKQIVWDKGLKDSKKAEADVPRFKTVFPVDLKPKEAK